MNLHRQQGATLIFALIMLMLLALLGVTGVNKVLLEEKMASASTDRNINFQAAEAGLSVAQAQVMNSLPTPAYVDADGQCPSEAINNCQNGICPTPDPDCPARWRPDSGFTGWTTASVNLGGRAITPEFYVEYLGSGFPCDPGHTDACLTVPKGLDCQCGRYQIVSRSRAEDRAGITLALQLSTGMGGSSASASAGVPADEHGQGHEQKHEGHDREDI